MRLAWVFSLLISIAQCNSIANNSVDLNLDNEGGHFPSTPGNSINILPKHRQPDSQEDAPPVPALEETENAKHNAEETTNGDLQNHVQDEGL